MKNKLCIFILLFFIFLLLLNNKNNNNFNNIENKKIFINYKNNSLDILYYEINNIKIFLKNK